MAGTGKQKSTTAPNNLEPIKKQPQSSPSESATSSSSSTSRPHLGKRKSSKPLEDDPHKEKTARQQKSNRTTLATSKTKRKGKAKAEIQESQPASSKSKKSGGAINMNELAGSDRSMGMDYLGFADEPESYGMLVDIINGDNDIQFGDGPSSGDDDEHENPCGWPEYSDHVDDDEDMNVLEDIYDDDEMLFDTGRHVHTTSKNIDDIDNSDDDHNEHNRERDDGPEDDDDDDDDRDDDDDDDDDDIDDDDDDDDDDLTSARLSRFRRNLGLPMLDLFGGMVTGMSGQFRNILQNLSNHNDQTQQLIALQELAETLSISTEENLLGSFQCDSFVRELVKIMKGSGTAHNTDMDEDMMLAMALSEQYGGGNPELMLLACRCISNLLDVLPSSASSVVSHGAVGVLCDKLKSIQYIDLAEQALGALEKIAGQAPLAVIQGGGLSASLMYFDFFSIHAQRTALQTASHCMRSINADSSQQVMETMPTLTNTLTYSDRTVVELTCLCWARLSERYRSKPDIFEKVISIDVLKTMLSLLPLPGNTNAVRSGTFNDLLRVFRSVSKTSPSLGYQLLILDIVGHFYQILTGAIIIPPPNEISHDTTSHSSLIALTTLDNKWQDSLYVILKIIIDLLPPLPKDEEFSWKRFDGIEPVALRTRSSKTTQSELTTPVIATSSTSTMPGAPDPRIQLFETNPQLLQRIGYILFPLLLEIYSSTVNLRVRQLVTHTLVKLVFFMNGDVLKVALHDVPLSGFLVSLLAQQEHSTFVVDALFQTEFLLKKLPGIYYGLFQREGVYYEINALANKSLAEDNAFNGNQRQHTLDETRGLLQLDDSSMMSDTNSESGRSQTHTQAPSQTLEDDAVATATPRHMVHPSQRVGALLGRNLMMNGQHRQQLKTATNLAPPLATREDKAGIGHGSLRRYIIQLAQNFIKDYAVIQESGAEAPHPLVTCVKDLKQFSDGLTGTADDPAARMVLENLVAYIDRSSIGVSGFELFRSGVLDGLLGYLTQQNDADDNLISYMAPLEQRRQTLYAVFMETLKLDEDSGVLASSVLRLLVKRLENLFTQFERFEVVSPLGLSSSSSSSSFSSSLSSSSSDSVRNPIHLLAKQIRVRLSGQGPDIPAEYQHLMVATHAVATFRVLEEYLLSHINDTESLQKLLKTDSHKDDDNASTSLIHTEEMDIDDNLRAKTDKHDTKEKKTSASRSPRRTLRRRTSSRDHTSAAAASSSSTSIKDTPTTSTTKKKGKWTIQFYMDGTLVSNDTTIYGAIHKSEMKKDTQLSSTTTGRSIWNTACTVVFKRVFVAENTTEATQKNAERQNVNTTLPKHLMDKNATCMKILQLLKELATLSQSWEGTDDTTVTTVATMATLVPMSDFVNRKMAAKMQRQLEEPLIVASSCLPDWTYYFMENYSFLFPFDVRYLYIQSTSFGYSRLIARWQSMQMRNNTQNGQRRGHSLQGDSGARGDGQLGGGLGSSRQQPILGNIERKKVLVKRDQILEYTIKIMNLLGNSQPVLEIEYMNEEGSGLGPTLEFYALASKEFCKKSINMWRQDGENDDDNNGEKGTYVVSQQGLFPAPLSKHSDQKSRKKVLQLFKSLGQFVARAMLDFRIIDIPFSASFFKLVLHRASNPVDMIKEIDPVLGKSIAHLQGYVDKMKQIENDTTMTLEDRVRLVENVEVNGAKIEDLCLDFTLPGTDIDLKRGGSQILVTMRNVKDYIQLLGDTIAGSGVQEQVSAFREGFNGLFCVDDLKVLTCQELVSLFGSSTEDWSYSTLSDTIKADHGFTMESKAVKNLLEILSEMNAQDQREFLQFTTGSPRLPIGGWKAMRPMFTVVRKNCEAPLVPDDYLPSVMTCANYLKMPDYSNKLIMQKQLLKSMQEGKNSFLLS